MKTEINMDDAIRILRENGPMTARKLAQILGLPDARSLSLRLQWQSKTVWRTDSGKWAARPGKAEK